MYQGKYKLHLGFLSPDKGLKRAVAEFLKLRSIKTTLLKPTDDFLTRIATTPTDLIVIDANLENISAEFICKQLRRKHPDLPIIVIAKRNDTAHINKFVRIPVTDFIIHPLNPEELYLRIKRIFRSRHTGLHNKIKNGELEIEAESKKVIFRKKYLKLSPREYNLLSYLTRNKGKVLSREEILNHVWGYDAYVIDRNVDVYIGYLRKKLKKHNGTEKYIKTVPSFGYMMRNFD